MTCSIRESMVREHVLEVVRGAALWRPDRRNLQARKAVPVPGCWTDKGTDCRIALGQCCVLVWQLSTGQSS